MAKEEKCIHDGHRKRLLDLAINAGVENLSEIQRVELFLTYIFPRGDVNPLAHRLLEKFSTFSQIVDAEICDLIAIKGISEISAKKIKTYGDLFYCYTITRMGTKPRVTCIADVLDLIEDALRFRNAENIVMIAISPACLVTHIRRINMKMSAQVSISVLELTNFLATAKPSTFVIAHCHPYGRATPSEADNDAFKMIKNICDTVGVNFLDSFILGEDGVYSHVENTIVRYFHDMDYLYTKKIEPIKRA